jgi:rhodanese-related sulfurtransferase
MGVPFSVDPSSLFASLFGPAPPVLLDARRGDIAGQSGRILPQAQLVDHGDGPALASRLDPSRAVVVACAHGHNRSQRLAAFLRAEGFAASILADGYDGWVAAGLPLVWLAAKGVELGHAPTLWVTRRRPKIDRVACPWLIRRFLDARARFLFTDPEWVLDIAGSEGGTALDIPGAAFEHEGALCSFDILLREFGLADFPPLVAMAVIIRGADTDSLALAPEAAGLLAISLGLSARHGDDDQAMLAEGFTLYDGLLAWAMNARGERHSWPRAAAAS